MLSVLSVVQGTNSEQDLTCPGFTTGFAQLPALKRLDLAGAYLGEGPHHSCMFMYCRQQQER